MADIWNKYKHKLKKATADPAGRENAESERPHTVRAEKKSARRIALYAFGAAAAAALVLVVGVGIVRNGSGSPPASLPGSESGTIGQSSGNASRLSTVLADEIVRYGDEGYYRSKYDDETFKWLDILNAMTPEQRMQMNLEPPVPKTPDVMYYNDVPYDTKTLSPETKIWLWDHYKMSEDEKKFTSYVPSELLPSAADDSIVRYENHGYYRDKHDDEFFDNLERCYPTSMTMYLSSVIPPSPDIYYVYGRLYEAESLSEDTIRWLGSYNFFINSATAMTQGYIPSELLSPGMGDSYANYPKIVNYDGKTFESSSLSVDTLRWVKWYDTLTEKEQKFVSYVPSELKYPQEHIFPAQYPKDDKCPVQDTYCYEGMVFNANELSAETIRWLNWYNHHNQSERREVGFVPGELYENETGYFAVFNPIPDEIDPDEELPFNLIGPDNVKLTYKDAARGFIEAPDNVSLRLGLDVIENGSTFHFPEFVYLAEQGSSEFKRYYVGDTFCGMKIVEAQTTFELIENAEYPIMQYTRGSVRFEGSITVDAYVKKVTAEDYRQELIRDGYYECAADGLPIIAAVIAPESGKAVPYDFTTSIPLNSEFTGNPILRQVRCGKELPEGELIRLTLTNLNMNTFGAEQMYYGDIENVPYIVYWADAEIDIPPTRCLFDLNGELVLPSDHTGSTKMAFNLLSEMPEFN